MTLHCVTLDGASTQKSWRGPQQIDSRRATDADVDIDAAGNAVVVWDDAEPGSANEVWSSRYVQVDQSWSTSERIDNLPAVLRPDSLAVSTDARGDALAVWSEAFGEDIIYTNWTDTDGAWNALARRIDNSMAPGIPPANAGPRLSMNAAGFAVAIWIQPDISHQNVWTNQFSFVAGWSTPTLIEASNATRASAPQIAVDAEGNAVAVWVMADTATFNVWSARYASGGDWGDAARVEFNDSGDADAPQIGVDSRGNAVAVWRQTNGTRFDIWSNHFTAGNWANAARIEFADEGDAGAPYLAVRTDGSAVVVWSELDRQTQHIWSNQYVPTRGWGVATRIENNDAGSATVPRVATSPDGTAVAVWKQSGGPQDEIWSNRYLPQEGWGEAEYIGSGGGTEIGDPCVAINPSGNAVAVWTSGGVWANRLE